MKKIWKLLAIIVLVFSTGYILEETIAISGINNPQSLEQTFALLSELFSVFVALSIFSITWHAYYKSRDNHSLFIGTIFLITGILILFHLLSYPFMPDFSNPNSTHKATIFFLESRLFFAFFLLTSVFVHKDSLPKLINRFVMILFTIVIMSVSMVSLFLYEDSFFMAFNIDTDSTATIYLLIVISTFILAASYLYRKRARETGEDNKNIIYGSLIVLISNLVYFFYEFSGHLLIITGFFYFYLGLYKSSIELPYEKLALAEEKLRKGVENKYRTLFDNANDTIITTDLKDGITSWNRSAEKLFGWKAQEVIGRKLSSLIVPPNLLTQQEGLIHDTLGGKYSSGIETERLHKEGNRIFVDLTTSQLLDSNNNLVGLSFIFRDITQKKKAENLLNKSKEFAETIINSMNDAISIIDVNNFLITDANSVYLKNCGMTKMEVIGKTCYEISHKGTHPCSSPDDKCPLIETMNTGKYSIAEHVHYSGGGERQYVEVSTSPIKNENGKVINVIYVAKDITERKLAKNKIEYSLKEKETLLREIHHRVKNNMQIISSLLNLQTHTIEDKKYKNIFIDSQTRIQAMALIHEKLYQSENLAQINFKEYVDEIVSNIFSSYRQNSNIKIDINIPNIMINIDNAVPCGLIINEIVTNSLKYAFPDERHGKIRISVEPKENNMIQFSISDDGIGIPEDLDIRKTKTLGMTLITALAENQLKGELVLNREKGTEFKINFRGTK